MPQRHVADLPDDVRPWDVHSHRCVARPLLEGPLPLATVVAEASRAGVPRENAYRVIRRLRGLGALGPQPDERGGELFLPERETARVRLALSRAEAEAQQPGPQRRAFADGGSVRHGDVLLEVHVSHDLMGAFAGALREVAERHPNVWAAATHGREPGYLLVTDDSRGDANVIERSLRRVGAECRRLQVSAPMTASALKAHADRLRRAGEGRGEVPTEA
jgi:hypothetical protein